MSLSVLSLPDLKVMWHCEICATFLDKGPTEGNERTADFLLDKVGLAQHLKQHYFPTKELCSDNNTHCSLCNITCYSNAALRAHVRHTHFHKRLVCDLCNQSFNEAEIGPHYQSHPQNDAAKSDASAVDSTDDVARSDKGEAKSKGPHEYQYLCIESQYEELGIERDDQALWCRLCGSVVPEEVAKHNKQHVKSKVSHMGTFCHCECCDIVYANFGTASNHIRKFHMTRVFSCWICEELLVSDYLKSHLTQCHGLEHKAGVSECKLCEVGVPDIVIKEHATAHIIESKRGETFFCSACPYSAKKLDLVQCHFKEAHWASKAVISEFRVLAASSTTSVVEDAAKMRNSRLSAKGSSASQESASTSGVQIEDKRDPKSTKRKLQKAAGGGADEATADVELVIDWKESVGVVQPPDSQVPTREIPAKRVRLVGVTDGPCAPDGDGAGEESEQDNNIIIVIQTNE